MFFKKNTYTLYVGRSDYYLSDARDKHTKATVTIIGDTEAMNRLRLKNCEYKEDLWARKSTIRDRAIARFMDAPSHFKVFVGVQTARTITWLLKLYCKINKIALPTSNLSTVTFYLE